MTTLNRRFRDLRYRVFYKLMTQPRGPLIELGNRQTYCHWVLMPDGLNARSIVYSGGVGRDLSFDRALVERFGCAVVLFDGTPTGQETMALPENQIPQFKYNPVALAGQCGKLTLTPPESNVEGSWSLRAKSAATVEVPCVDLATLMERNGHDHIDLLKIDIEGAEYGVIDDFLKRRLPIRQVLVEFHHGFFPESIRPSQTIRAIVKMKLGGYRLIHVDVSNHTFLRD